MPPIWSTFLLHRLPDGGFIELFRVAQGRAGHGFIELGRRETSLTDPWGARFPTPTRIHRVAWLARVERSGGLESLVGSRWSWVTANPQYGDPPIEIPGGMLTFTSEPDTQILADCAETFEPNALFAHGSQACSFVHRAEASWGLRVRFERAAPPIQGAVRLKFVLRAETAV